MISFKLFLILISSASLVVCQESGVPSTPSPSSQGGSSSAATGTGCQNRTRRTEPDYYEDYDDYEDYYRMDMDSILDMKKRSIGDLDDEYDEEVVFSRAGNRRRTPTKAKIVGEKDAKDGVEATPSAEETNQTIKKKQTRKSNKKSTTKRGGHRGHKHIKPIGQCLPEKSGWCLAINNTATTEGVAKCDEKLDYCTDDCDCPGYQKCCYNSCGRTECLPSFTTITTDGPSTEAPTTVPVDNVTEPVVEMKEPALSLI